MLPVVYSLEEARDFFIENLTGNVICKDGDREREVNCYPDAVRFYNK
jgi:hypothetical protein